MIAIAPENANIFESKAQVIVNPVNCVGAMGKGLALAFKQTFPNVFIDYSAVCKKSRPENLIGTVISATKLETGQVVLCVPTKLHWRDPAKISYITSALDAIDCWCTLNSIKHCTLPALGAGLGGLPWEEVFEKIENRLSGSNTKYFIIPPPTLYLDHTVKRQAKPLK